jgi:hypothetical protein
MTRLQTVVELDSFLKRAKAIMSDEERMGIVTYLAANPEATFRSAVACARSVFRVQVVARAVATERSMYSAEHICTLPADGVRQE